MDFLNRALSQLSDLFRSMTPGGRIISGLLLVVIVISLVYLINFQGTGPDDFLFAGQAFSISELSVMETAFAKAGLGNYEIKGNRISVSRGQKQRYIAAIADGDALPPTPFSYIDHALQRFGMFSSHKQREEDLNIARQRELSLIIRNMRGIEDATVHYDSIVESSFPRRVEKTAAVSIWPSANQYLDEGRVESIRDLVTASIAGLKSDKVTVTDMNSGRTRSGGTRGAANASNPYPMLKRTYENDWTEKIRESLSYVQGAIVSVNVTLKTDLVQKRQSLKVERKATPLQTANKKNSTRATTNQAADDELGVAARGSNQAATVGDDEQRTQSQNEESLPEVVEKPSGDRIYKIKTPLVPSRVTVSVAVPSSYYLNIWRERNPIKEGGDATEPGPTELKNIEEEIKTNIEETVVGLLPPKPPGENVYQPVHVTTFQHLTSQPLPKPALAESATSWLSQHGTTICMLLVGLVSLLMLRGLVRSIPRDPVTPSAPESQPSFSIVGMDEENPDISEAGRAEARRTLHRKSISDPNLREELTDLVHEDPDAAANVLSNWIGNVG